MGARGLDVADVSWIVQFHPPGPPEDYVHRVGRCARAGSSGNALLFLTPTETGYVNHLREKADITALEEVPLLKVLVLTSEECVLGINELFWHVIIWPFILYFTRL